MSPVALVSFDIDGTLEIGEPPGIVTVAAMHTARRLGYLMGTCSDRPLAHQRQLWERLPVGDCPITCHLFIDATIVRAHQHAAGA